MSVIGLSKACCLETDKSPEGVEGNDQGLYTNQRKQSTLFIKITIENILLVMLGLLVNYDQIKGETIMSDGELITREDIQHLPQSVQRCMKYSQVIGTPKIKKVCLKQTGIFKTAPHKPWAPFTADQWFNVDGASFEWRMDMKMAPFVHVKGVDRLSDGKGEMKIRLFGIIPLINAKGPEIDQGSMTRYLSEMIWFPQGFINEYIRWEAIDDFSARAIFTVHDKSVEGIFYFDDLGRMTEFTCDRYSSEGKEMVLRPWHATIYEYGECDGVMIGTKGKVTWRRPEGDYTYIDLEITELKHE